MGITRGRWRLAAGLSAAGMVTAMALAGCGADSGSDDAGTSTGFAGEGVAEAPAAAPAEQDKAGAAERDKAGALGQEAERAPTKFQVDDRSIIYIGSITVRTEKAGDVNEAAVRAIGIVSGAGGFISSDKRTSDNGNSQASLELRVPADRFATVVDQLAELGEEESRGINTEDVTEQVVDVEARVATQQASVNRTRALLAQAKTIAEIVAVEGELAKREAELGSLQAKQRRLADLTALSTITLMLLGPDVDVVENEPETGFVAGVKAGWKAFLASMEVLLTVLGALLPWVIVLGAPVFGLVWLLRRLGRRPGRAAPVTPAGGTPQEPPAPAAAP